MMSGHLPLKIGFVPLIDCAPLVLAHELGFFQEEGVEVKLIREPGWASIRDKVVYGELDAALAPAGLCFAISWGVQNRKLPCLTSFLTNTHGDAITIAKKWIDAGVKDSKTLAETLARDSRSTPFVLGVPHQFSSHHFLLRQWLRTANLLPERDVEIVVIPPSQMNNCLEEGHLDGFCVGEPYNTEAVLRGTGEVVITSYELVPMHPEKALLVSAKLVADSPNTHTALVMALSRACELCDSNEGKSQAAPLLSKAEFLGVSGEIIHASLFSDRPEFHRFYGREVNCPSQDKANWLVSEMRSAGILEKTGGGDNTGVQDIFRQDLYAQIVSGAGT